MHRSILRFSEIGPEDRGAVGNKAWYLSRLVQAGFDVPPGLVIPREALGPEVLPELWDKLSPVLPGVLRLEEGIAVRSSSTAEDTLDRSMAGQFLTILRVKSFEALKSAIESCAGSRRAPAEGKVGDAAPAVILQAMVEADLAGVAFSRDPVSGEGEAAVIEYCPGTAESLVSAEISPFRVAIEGPSLRPYPGSPEAPAEHHAVLREVAGLLRRIEGLFGFPVDVEWAAKDGRARVIQARPITRRTAPRSRAGGVPPGTWTRRIAEDLWADPLTTFEEGLLVSLSPRFDLRRWSRYLGLAIPEETRSIAAIQSNLYLSCDVLKLAMAMVPRKLRLDFLIALFPPGTEIRAGPGPGPFRTVRAVLGALFLGVTRLEANPLTCSLWIRRRTRRIAGEARALNLEDLSRRSAPELKAHLERCLGLLGRLLASNQFPYTYAVLFSSLVEHAAKVLGVPRESWLAELGGTQGNATARQISLLSELGEALNGAGVKIEGRTFEDAIEELRGRKLEKAIDAARILLEEYGVRSSQRSLVEPRWAESPLSILEHAMNISREKGREERRPREKKALGIILRCLVKITNRYLDLREDLRFALDGVLFSIRRTILEIGKRSGLDRRAFFLHPEEVLSLLSGELLPAAAGEMGKERLERFLAAPPPPPFWVEGVPVEAGAPSGNSLKGIGASPGVVRGRVRVVERLEEAERAQGGEILVARMMGPSWTPILGFALAVVTEKGGLLDHFAILAREAGVPAVTGAEGATRALESVETATVDGTRGLVWW